MAESGRARLILALLVVLGVGLWCLRPIWDIDLWWHVAVGRHVLAGGIPDTDLFSAAHPEAPWHSFQWGYELLVAGVDGLAGPRGLQLLHAGVVGAAAGLAVACFREPRRALVVLAVGLLLFEDRVRERPHVFELLFVVGLLPVLAERVRGHPVVLVLLAVIWANVHAVSALWWLALVGAWVLGAPSKERALTWLAGLGTMAAIGPARRGLLGALSSHRSWPAELVPELRPTWAYVDEGWWGMVMLAGVGAGVVAAALLWRSAWPRGLRLALLGCALAACLMGRWAWFAAIPLGLWLAGRGPRVQGALVLACALALVGRSGLRWPPSERFEALQPGRWPVEACDWIAAQGLSGPTDTTPTWSGYVLYRLPAATVLADGRLVFAEDVTDLLLRRGAGELSTFDEAVERYGTELLLWPSAGSPPLDEARWELLYEDPVAQVWRPRS